jgi:phosphoribosylpyrophosphate synthetase
VSSSVDVIYTNKTKDLSESIAKKMSKSAFSINTRNFNHGAISVSLQKRFHDAVVIATTETNDDWIELFFLLDALKDSSNITLCLTYMGYSRQDQQLQNESFASGLFTRLLEQMNISRCIVVDNHSRPFFLYLQ